MSRAESSLLIVELDGTLANSNARSKKYLEKEDADWTLFYSPEAIALDKPYRNEIAFVLAFWAEGRNVVEIWTGRDEICRKATLAWIQKHVGVTDVVLRMRPSNFRRPVNELKADWADKYTEGYEHVFALDNRNVSFWRTQNICCFQTRKLDY